MPRDRYVILHIWKGRPHPDNSPQIAADVRFELSEDIWIERFAEDYAIRIQKACEPANHRIDNIVDDRHFYAFVREPNVGLVSGNRDEAIGPLSTVIALSRLIRPTSTGDRYCACIVGYPGVDPPIRAVQISGVCPDVFLGDNSRDWLSPHDGLELRKLMPWVSVDRKMHDRVYRALWNHEQAMRTYYLDTRWTIVVAGLDALINVDDEEPSKWQFVRRVGKLAVEFGIALSEPELKNAWKLRSKLAHGQSFLYGLHTILAADEHKPLYDKLESVLRAAVKKCLLDQGYGAHFADGAAIRAYIP